MLLTEVVMALKEIKSVCKQECLNRSVHFNSNVKKKIEKVKPKADKCVKFKRKECVFLS